MVSCIGKKEKASFLCAYWEANELCTSDINVNVFIVIHGLKRENVGAHYACKLANDASTVKTTS